MSKRHDESSDAPDASDNAADGARDPGTDPGVADAGAIDGADRGARSPGSGTPIAEAAADPVLAERDKYLRLAAEFDNYRKRSARERQEAGWRAQSEMVGGLVEALDDIMRFAHLDPETVDSGTVIQGVALVEKKLTKTLSGHGLEILNPVDQQFDPAFHEAVGTVPAESSEDDHMIARVYQPGYVFRGQLLRPARVLVKQWLGSR